MTLVHVLTWCSAHAGHAFLTADPATKTSAALQAQLQASLCVAPAFVPSVAVPAQCAVRACRRGCQVVVPKGGTLCVCFLIGGMRQVQPCSEDACMSTRG